MSMRISRVPSWLSTKVRTLSRFWATWKARVRVSLMFSLDLGRLWGSGFLGQHQRRDGDESR